MDGTLPKWVEGLSLADVDSVESRQKLMAQIEEWARPAQEAQWKAEREKREAVEADVAAAKSHEARKRIYLIAYPQDATDAELQSMIEGEPVEDAEDEDTVAHEKAALRELREETGLVTTIDKLRYHGFFDHKWREFDLRVYSYSTWLEDMGDQEPRVVEEGTKFFWAERDALLDDESGCLNTAFYGWLMAKLGWDHYEAE